MDQTCLLDSSDRNVPVLGRDLYAQPVPSKLFSYQPDRSGAHEGIENHTRNVGA